MYNTLILDLIKIFNEGAYLSIVLKPTLWRVFSYSWPGLPKPTINFTLSPTYE